MSTISKAEARAAFECAEQTAEVIVRAKYGAYDPDNLACLKLYLHVFSGLIDARLKEWRLNDLLAYIYR
jgi:hypothetical protein